MTNILHEIQDYDIVVTPNKCGDRFLLNYGPTLGYHERLNPLPRATRALMVDKDGKIISRSFPRFFNLGEYQDNDHFNWNCFETYSKEDGSLCVLYHDKGEWKVHTRRSFGDGCVGDSNYNWTTLFMSIIDDSQLHVLNKNYSYSFELCSRYNRVVRDYAIPELFLLAGFDLRADLYEPVELCDELLDYYAKTLEVRRPDKVQYSSLEELQQDLKCLGDDDHTFEGFVVRDIGFKRLKIKNAHYIYIHQIVNNVSESKLAHLLRRSIFNGEKFELLQAVPYLADAIENAHRSIDDEIEYIKQYSHLFEIEGQKDFAMTVNHLKYPYIFFYLRKHYKNNITRSAIMSALQKFQNKVWA